MRSADASPIRSGTGQPVEKLYLENTLLRVCGALFCHHAKSASKRFDEIVLTGGGADKQITVRPDPRLGQPGPLAHKLFVALIKKHSDCGLPVRREVSFTRREIGRMIGRHSWGGRDSEQLSRALHEIHHATVKAHFRKDDGRHIEHSFSVFPEIWIERRALASDPIEACTVKLADPVIASLEEAHFTCLNHGLMSEFGTIGQALYMRLFFHFANLYTGRNRGGLAFAKRYDDLCREWLGGLTALTHRSKIAGEQLGPHLDKLVATGFLRSYSLTRAKSKNGFVIGFQPGELFFTDYDRFYRAKSKPRQEALRPPTAQLDSAPLKLAYLFAQKRTGQVTVPFVSSKEVATARRMLQQLPLADMPGFIDFALERAHNTGFDVQSLGGIAQYMPDYLAAMESRRENAARLRAIEKADADGRDQTRRNAERAKQLFRQLTPDKRSEIEAAAERQAARFSGSLAKRMKDHYRVTITLERHGQSADPLDA